MPILHLPSVFSKSRFSTVTIFQDRQSRCRHFIQALANFQLLTIIQDKLLAYTWDSNDNHDTMWFVEKPCSCSYKYSKYDIQPRPYFPELKQLATFVEKVTGSDETNSVNVNLYRDQYAKVGLHSDSEDLFQARYVPSTIISISLGAARSFILQAINGSGATYPINLEHGDIITMEGLCQRDYKHALPPARAPCGPRINLTFRKIVQHRQHCSLANI